MIVRFPDHRSLALAHEDLLRIGVPEQRIAPYFEERQPEEAGTADHETFLKQLHVWVRDSKESSFLETPAGPYSPTSPLFMEHGGTLNIKCPQLEHAIVETILKHDGQLVG